MAESGRIEEGKTLDEAKAKLKLNESNLGHILVFVERKVGGDRLPVTSVGVAKTAKEFDALLHTFGQAANWITVTEHDVVGRPAVTP